MAAAGRHSQQCLRASRLEPAWAISRAHSLANPSPDANGGIARSSPVAAEHGVWFPRGTPSDASRTVFIFRWSAPGRLREFNLDYPHYILLSEEERAECARRAEAAAAKRRKWAEPPPPLRVQPPRAVAGACEPTYYSLRTRKV